MNKGHLFYVGAELLAESSIMVNHISRDELANPFHFQLWIQLGSFRSFDDNAECI